MTATSQVLFLLRMMSLCLELKAPFSGVVVASNGIVACFGYRKTYNALFGHIKQNHGLR